MAKSYRKAVCPFCNGRMKHWKRQYNRSFRRTENYKVRIEDYDNLYSNPYKMDIADIWFSPADGYFMIFDIDYYDEDYRNRRFCGIRKHRYQLMWK